MKKKIIMALVIAPLLVCCSNGKTTDKFKSEPIESGKLSYEEAMNRLYQRIKIKDEYYKKQARKPTIFSGGMNCKHFCLIYCTLNEFFQSL